MGDLEKRIAKDLKESIKNKAEIRTSTLRMVTAAIQNLAIEKRLKELDDDDVAKILSKQLKQHQDSIESFKKGGRGDLVEKETKELEILKTYLPEQAGEEKIKEIVNEVISKMDDSSRSDFNKVMKLSMQELKGRADGKAVSSVVQKLLSK